MDARVRSVRRLAATCLVVVTVVGCASKAPPAPATLPAYEEDPRDRRALRRHAEKLFAEAHGLSRAKRYPDAARFAMEGLGYRARVVGNFGIDMAPTLLWVGDALTRDGQYDLAFQVIRRAETIASTNGWAEMSMAANRRLGLLTRLRAGAQIADLDRLLAVAPPPPERAEIEPRRPPPAPSTAPAAPGFVAAPVVTRGHVENAAATVAALRMRFGECFARGLAADRAMGGRVDLRLRVDAEGRVSGMAHSHSGTLSQWVVDCVRWVAGQARFSRPPTGEAELEFPVNFEREPG